MGYPTVEQEAQILARFKEEDPLTDLEPVLDGETILKLRKEVTKVHLSQDLMDYVARLAAGDPRNPPCPLGSQPKGSLALMRCALAYAYLQGRDYVLPDDLKYCSPMWPATV